MDSSAGAGYCSYAGVPLQQYKACAGMSASPSRCMTQPFSLSPVLFMHVGDPYIPPFYINLKSFCLLDILDCLFVFGNVCTHISVH